MLLSAIEVRAQTLVAWGSSVLGQTNVPTSATNVIAVAAGYAHALALTTDGSVISWGLNADGQTNVPPEATNVVAVAAGARHSLALLADGSVLAWGGNLDGQTTVPTAAANTAEIAAGDGHSLALQADGTVVAWGNNDYGQASVPLSATGLVAIAAGRYHSLALRSDHTVLTWGLQSAVPAAATNIVAIAGGWQHSLALRADGTVIAWGDNTYGESEVPATATTVVGIAAGFYHNLALRADGTVVAWGGGDAAGALWGVTNVPTSLAHVAGLAAGEDYSVAIVELGPPRFRRPWTTVRTHIGGQALLGGPVSGTRPLSLQWLHDGTALSGATGPYLLLTNVQSTDAGTYTLLITNSAAESGSQTVSLQVLSAPMVASIPAPMRVLLGTSFCLPADVLGEEPLNCKWRLNGEDLTDGGRISGATTRILCISSTAAEDSGNYSLVVSNGSGCVTGLVAQVIASPILAWGNNSLGQLDIPPEAADAVAVAGGGDHSLALRANGTVAAWGDNSVGQNNVPASVSNVVAIAAGDFHSLALRADGRVVAWGDDSRGQATVPPNATNIVAIAAGKFLSLALRLDGSVLAWGSNSFRSIVLPPSMANAAAIVAGGGRCLTLQTNGQLILQEDNSVMSTGTLTNGVVAVAAGRNRTLAMQTNGAVSVWGGSAYEQTSMPAFATNILGLAVGGDHNLVRLADGTVACWGANYLDQLSAPATATNVLAVSAGSTHSLVLASNGTKSPAYQPLTIEATITQPTLLSAGAAAGALAHYQWQLNGIALAGATDPALSLAGVHWTNGGTYQLMISNAFGCVTGAPIILTVLRTALRFEDYPWGLRITNGVALLRLTGASGVGPVVLFSSSDMLTWQPILTNPPVLGPVELAAPAHGGPGAKFYNAAEGTTDPP